MNKSILLIFYVFSLLFYTSCNDDESCNDETNQISVFNKWKLVKRSYYFLGGSPLLPVDIDETCTIELFADSTIIYSDSLLNYYFNGILEYNIDFNKYMAKFDSNSYLYYIGDDLFVQDTLRTYHNALPLASGDPARYIDLYILINE